MANNKKYNAVVTQSGEQWLAQIVRQVTSKKTMVSKEQGGFNSEQDAIIWCDAQLLEFTAKQNSSNQRHGAQRKATEEMRLQRSSQRAEKTAAAKEKLANEAALESEIESDAE